MRTVPLVVMGNLLVRGGPKVMIYDECKSEETGFSHKLLPFSSARYNDAFVEPMANGEEPL